MQTALDLIPEHLTICRDESERLGITNVRLVHGTAVALPFPQGSFDIVINIESSHMYPDWSAFACSVARVLRIGGAFAWTDIVAFGGHKLIMGLEIRGLSLVRQIMWLLDAIGMDVVLVDDIGVNVMIAMWDHSHNQDILNMTLHLERSGEQHLALPGTALYQRYVGSDSRYPFIVAHKRDDSGLQKCSKEGLEELGKELDHRLKAEHGWKMKLDQQFKRARAEHVSVTGTIRKLPIKG